jgi:hypothetical protein
MDDAFDKSSALPGFDLSLAAIGSGFAAERLLHGALASPLAFPVNPFVLGKMAPQALFEWSFAAAYVVAVEAGGIEDV